MANSGPPKFNPDTCLDILGFQDYLKSLRTVDDSIIFNLNTTVTSSEKDAQQNTTNCNRFHEQLKEAYESRNKVINICLGQAEAKVADLKAKQSDSDYANLRDLKRHQNSYRCLQKELTIEQIIQDRSLKALHERCRRYVNF